VWTRGTYPENTVEEDRDPLRTDAMIIAEQDVRAGQDCQEHATRPHGRNRYPTETSGDPALAGSESILRPRPSDMRIGRPTKGFWNGASRLRATHRTSFDQGVFASPKFNAAMGTIRLI
jgi:hypothetical protein